MEHVAGHLTLVVALTAGGHAMTHCAKDMALVRALGAATSSWAAASCTRTAVVRATRAGLLAERGLAADPRELIRLDLRIDHTGLRILCRPGIIHPVRVDPQSDDS